MEKIKPYQSLLLALKPVSRSFYLSLKILPGPVKFGMGLGYFLCRLADTLADTDLLPENSRLLQLQNIRKIFERFPLSIDEFRNFLVKTIDLAEPGVRDIEILKNANIHIDSWWPHLSRTDQALVQKVVLGVIRGMEMDLSLFNSSSKTFKSKKELEDYLHHIGGEPGNFWTQLCLTHFPSLGPRHKTSWADDGIRFGTGLQMINILRDFPEDLKRGRCYIPEHILLEHKLTIEDLEGKKNPEVFLTLYHRLIDDTLNRLEHGLTYICALPRGAVRLRLAAGWPLLIGLQTLKKMRAVKDPLSDKNSRVKISRKEIKKTMLSSIFYISFNRLLERKFRKEYAAACSKITG